MSDVSQWSPVDANNNATPPDGFPEGMPASTVNDASRAVMGGARRQFEDGGWFNWGHAATYVSSTVFQVPGDLSAVYFVGRRVRIDQTSTVYGSISNVLVTANTDVTVTLDSGVIANEAMQVSTGVDPKAEGVVTLGTAAQEDVGTAIGNVVQLENVGGVAGLPAVDGSQLNNLQVAVELLETQTVTVPAGAVDFTNPSYFSEFSSFRLKYETIIPATNNVNFWLRVFRGGVPSAAAEYTDANIGVAGDASSFSDSTVQDRHGIAGQIDNTAVLGGISGETTVYNSPSKPFFISHCVWRRVGAFGPITGNVVYGFATDGTIDGFRFLCSSGNIQSGTFKIYGLR